MSLVMSKTKLQRSRKRSRPFPTLNKLQPIGKNLFFLEELYASFAKSIGNG